MSEAVGAHISREAAQIPGLVQGAQDFAQGYQVGSHIGGCVRNEQYMNRLFGDPGQECC